MDTGQPLANLRHERFAQLVVSGLPQSRAYIEAGYAVSPTSAEQSASRLSRQIKVASRIVALHAAAIATVKTEIALVEAVRVEQAASAVASAAWIAQQAVEVVARALAAVPLKDAKGKPILDEEGNPVMGDGNLSAATPALALLSKMHPEFSDKIDARVLHGVVKIERGTRELS